MKKIVVACGSGVATSTAVGHKIADLLDANGLSGQYHIVQCSIAEAPVSVLRRCASGRNHYRSRRHYLRVCEWRALPDGYGQS